MVLKTLIRRGRAGLALGLAIVAWSLPLGAPARAAAPNVVATIRPVHSLVAQVMGDVGAPVLLLRGAAEPHDYALKPDDARRLAAAGGVVMIGPRFETFLARPLANLARDARVLALADMPGMVLPPDERGGRDEHLWLDPDNAARAIGSIAGFLAALDPANAAAYRKNAAAARTRLAVLDRTLARTLAPVRDAPFVVYHDAFRAYAGHFGLALVGAVVVGGEHSPGAARLGRLHAKIAARGVRCLFTEPQFTPAAARALVAGTDARIAALDPLGTAIPPGPGLYDALMREVTASFVACAAR